MADLTITAANVVPAADAVIVNGTAGATITAGQAVYRDPSSRKFLLADTDSATAAVRDLYGIATHGASLNQPLAVQTGGSINPGATVAVGVVYVLSGTAGGICPTTDLAAGDYTAVIGVGTTTSNIKLGIVEAGVAYA